MEFGCGTAQISLELFGCFEKYTLLDSSNEMLKIAQNKINQRNISNYSPLNIDIFSEDRIPNSPFDAIYSAMTFHHIVHIENLLSKFSKLQPNSGSRLYIIDLYTEGGSFHKSKEEEFIGHLGFDPKELSLLAKKYNYKETALYELLTIAKTFESTENNYPVFFLCLEKN